MGLFSLFNLGNSAFQASSAGVAASGRNIANANTEGYQRENVDLQSDLGMPLVGGVIVGPNLIRSDDPLLAISERLAVGQQGNADALLNAVSGLEGAMATQSGDLVQSIAQLFGSLADLASAPMDDPVRLGVINDAKTMVTSFHTAASAVAQAQSDADQRLVNQAAEATDLAKQIADLNRQIMTAGFQSDDPVLYDQRDLAAQKLSALVGGQTRVDPDGGMRVTINGIVLVDGAKSYTMKAVPDNVNGGHMGLQVVDGTHVDVVTSQLGGKMGGEIHFRDVVAAQAATDLDQLAYDLATRINAVHRTNAAMNGTTGRDFFVEPTVVAGAAANLALSTTIAGDPRLIAAAAPATGPGDNQGVMALLALRDQTLAGGGQRTFVDEAVRTLGAVGAAAMSAKSSLKVATTRVQALKATRDSVSGVSIEEELNKLAQFQHAHDAATRFVATVNELLDTLMNKI